MTCQHFVKLDSDTMIKPGDSPVSIKKDMEVNLQVLAPAASRRRVLDIEILNLETSRLKSQRKLTTNSFINSLGVQSMNQERVEAPLWLRGLLGR